tara:strand:- start:2003 stop:2233 length:231 start_codon:yes stop_codon:yes gene_type:complete
MAKKLEIGEYYKCPQLYFQPRSFKIIGFDHYSTKGSVRVSIVFSSGTTDWQWMTTFTKHYDIIKSSEDEFLLEGIK